MSRFSLYRPVDWLWFVVSILMAVAIAKGLWDFAWRLEYELTSWNSDSTVYWTMGRALLNGLMPYRDLLEIKPPGIMFISAASLWLTGDMTLGHLLQMLVIAAVPVVILIPAWKLIARFEQPRRYFLLALTLVFGLAIAMYDGFKSGEYQVESFGIVWTLAYAGVAALDDGKFSWKRVLLATLFLFLSIGMKEPFVLTLIATGLILSRHPKDLWRILILPLLITAVVGVLLMLILGYLQPYIDTYLWFMLGEHISRFGPSWVRGFGIHEVIEDLYDYTPALLALVTALWLGGIAILGRSWQNVSRLSASATIFIGTAMAFYGAFYVLMARHFNAETPGFAMPYLLGGLFLLVGASIVFLLQTPARERMKNGWGIDRVLIALYLSIFAAGMGGEYIGHHISFIVPVYVGFFYLLLRTLRDDEDNVLWAMIAIVAVFASATVFTQSITDYAKQQEIRSGEYERSVQEAAHLDRVMDQCGVGRYLYAADGLNYLYGGFNTHSPLGPAFFQYTYNMTIPRFQQTFIDNLNKAQIIVTGRGAPGRQLPDEVWGFIDQEFTTEPWDCAKPYEQPGYYQLYFRKGGPYAE